MSALSDSFGVDSIAIRDSVANRNQAIVLAGELLVASGRVQLEYVHEMVSAVETHGPYIVIAPGIALAHGRPSEFVIETGMSLLMLNKGVEFKHSQNDPVRLVFGLAAVDHSSHISVMAELSNYLSDDSNVNSLLTCSDASQMRALLP